MNLGAFACIIRSVAHGPVIASPDYAWGLVSEIRLITFGLRPLFASAGGDSADCWFSYGSIYLFFRRLG